MSAIAIIGPDGAGKTTITRRLAMGDAHRYRYVYMGLNINACSHVLPTTRWAERIKYGILHRTSKPARGRAQRALQAAGFSLPHGNLWAVARFVNHLADEWYRQLASWYFQLRGFVVIYDRHFVFDLWDGGMRGGQSLSNRIHDWLLKRFFPRPDLVILLDAPSEVLFARKREWSIEDLDRKRETFLRLAKQLRNFSIVDATQPAEIVYSKINRIIHDFLRARSILEGTDDAWPLRPSDQAVAEPREHSHPSTLD